MTTVLLRIFVIHHSGGGPDDTIVISRVVLSPLLSEPLFRIEFTTSNVEGDRVTYRSHMNRDRTESYIHTLLKGLRSDSDPFKSIQISSSVYPSIMYEIDSLGWEERETIMNMIMATIANNVTRVRTEIE
jgi:hypothetical protein